MYLRATEVAAKVGVSTNKSGTVNKQINGNANANVGGYIEAHYKVNFYYPFISHVIQHLNVNRFPVKIKGVLLASFLIPEKLHVLDECSKIEQVALFLSAQTSSARAK